MDCHGRDAQLSGPLSNGQGSTAVRYKAVRTLVVRLLLTGGPHTVLWRVPSVIVTALNRVRIGRGISHVGVEVLEAFQPTIADSDSASAVVFVLAVGLPEAAVFHC